MIDNSGDVFPGFLFISTHIVLDLLSLGSAEAYIGWGWRLNSNLMASCVRNIRAKNYQNLIIGFQVTVENVGDAFFETQCIYITLRYCSCRIVSAFVLQIEKTKCYFVICNRIFFLHSQCNGYYGIKWTFIRNKLSALSVWQADSMYLFSVTKFISSLKS